TSTGWAYHACLNLNYSNRPVRTRMPGGVAGDRSAMLAAPMPIAAPAAASRLSNLKVYLENHR
ncbi:hypothetical protein, partial [Rugamonas fusca]|uniref:hypothetical protein n=1 Tax=Rugamonas fusca TaxID=2758568 RepID=UPI001C70FBED